YVLMARMALWDKDYNLAIDYANRVIDSGKYQLTTLDEVFKANSEEAIWQLLPTNPSIGASEGSVYILENNPGTPKAASSQNLTEDLLSIWELGDMRYSHWINVYTEGENDY